MFSEHSITADWFIQQVILALIHSAVYGMAYHFFKGLSLGGAVLACLCLLVVAWLAFKLFRR
ncbi:MAG TPA: hypothetical protein DE312_04550 [Gallionella sp.]|nr:MAG: hypothetical protein A2Z87_06160 [Gallionellales bacterium GWA2_54_124]HCI52574.1 hypothetical protein [Gallionella sp.]